MTVPSPRALLSTIKPPPNFRKSSRLRGNPSPPPVRDDCPASKIRCQSSGTMPHPVSAKRRVQ